MADEPSNLTFTAFLLSLATTTAVHFGDLPDPASGQKETNLPAASQMIDILGLLEEKTRGNLNEEESALLGQLLYELRLRYVEARQAGESRIIRP